MKTWQLFVTCPAGVEGLLSLELKSLGLSTEKETAGGVHATATLESIYKVCIWSRLANRVYLPLLIAPVGSSKDLYEACASYKWDALLKKGATIAVDFAGMSDSIRNTMFGGQVVKDAIVDQIQKSTGDRPNVEPKNPDCLIHARLHHDELALYYDLSGHSLHQRGYRKKAGVAPLKENLAAAILIRAGWPNNFVGPLLDPFCGSATILIEAAMMATDKAPGLDRLDYGFLNWGRHDESLWDTVQRQALERHEAALDAQIPQFIGFDSDPEVVKVAKSNIRAAGLSEHIHVEAKDIRDLSLPDFTRLAAKSLVTNPPYGERIGESKRLAPVYEKLGYLVKNSKVNAAILTSDPDLARATGLWSHKQYAFLNGKIPCKLYLFQPKA